MRKLVGLIFVILILSCCKHEKNTEWFWVSFRRHEYQKADSTPIKRFYKLIYGDTTKYFYQTKFQRLEFYTVKSSDSAFAIENPRDSLIHLNDSIVFMPNIYDTIVIFRRDTFEVKKFIRDEFVQDGSSTWYFTPTLGIFAAHSNTWAGITFLQTNDSIINKEIYFLIKATVPRFYIRGTLQKKLSIINGNNENTNVKQKCFLQLLLFF
jgi:hypothetical protein